MAKIHLNRLVNKYGKNPVSGNIYQNLIKLILAENTQAVQNKVGRIAKVRFEKQAEKYRKQNIRMVLPDMQGILPKRSIQLLKSADRGKLITDTLRDSLTKKLRERLSEFKESGKQSFVKPTGKAAGRVNQELVNSFKEDIQSTFENYVKRGKTERIPSNIDSIATTEIRTAIKTYKMEYMREFIHRNPHLEVNKSWIQNRRLSKVPRIGHNPKNFNSTVPWDMKFQIPNYVNDKIDGYVMMESPHDENGGASNVISCHCDLDILIRKNNE